MKTGWIQWNDKFYYCDDSGAMLAGTVAAIGICNLMWGG